MTANEKQFGGGHYKGTGYEHWDFVHDARLGYHDGTATKYIYRWQKKGAPIVDLEKAGHYLEKCIELQIKHRYFDGTARPSLARFVEANGVGPQEAAAIDLICRGKFREARQIVAALLGHAIGEQQIGG